MPDKTITVKEAIDRSPVGGAQAAILLVCFLLSAVDGYDLLSMSFAAPPLEDDWQLGKGELGIAFSAGLLGMVLGAMFLSPLTDLLGRRPMILASVTVIGCAMLLTAYTWNLPTLAAMRALTGLGIGAILSSLTSLLSEFYPERRRNFAIGVNLAGLPVGGGLGGFLATWLIPQYGWQGVFLAGGIATLAALPLIWLLLPESTQFLLHKRPKNALARINRTLARMRIAPLEELPPPPASAAKPSVLALLNALLKPERRRDTLLLWTGFFLNFSTLYFLLSWIPLLLKAAGLPLAQAIYASVAFNLGGVVGNAGIGWISAHFSLQRSILTFSLAAAIGMLAFASFDLEIAALLTLTAIIGLFQQGSMTGYYAIAARAYPTEIRTTGVGWGIGLGRIGAVVSPALTGLLLVWGWSMDGLYLFFAVPMLFVGWIATRLHPRH